MYENKEEIEKVILFAVDLDNGEQVPWTHDPEQGFHRESDLSRNW